MDGDDAELPASEGIGLRAKRIATKARRALWAAGEVLLDEIAFNTWRRQTVHAMEAAEGRLALARKLVAEIATELESSEEDLGPWRLVFEDIKRTLE